MRPRSRFGETGYADSIALVVLAAVLVVTAVWYAASHLGKPNTPLVSDAPSPTASASMSALASPTTSPTTPAARAAETVRAFYDQYLAAAKAQNSTRLAALIDQYAAPDLALKLKSAESRDPVLCAPTPPDALDYSAPSLASATALIDIQATTGTRVVPIAVKLRTTDFKLAAITCP